MNSKKIITFIGAGNVATHLAKSFFDKGFVIQEVYSKNIGNAKVLANNINANFCNDLKQINDKSHIYIISVKDDALAKVITELTVKDKLIIHTSGSVEMDIFNNHHFTNYGILYPLQTFSKDNELDIYKVPFCIEANTKENEVLLIELAKSISENVQLINSEERKKIHLAAVFACNFSNYMYQVADNLLSKESLDFDILKPLIIETANKILNNPPKSMQTGPAKRKDTEVIENHIKMLADSPSYQDIYKIITDNIIKDN